MQHLFSVFLELELHWTSSNWRARNSTSVIFALICLFSASLMLKRLTRHSVKQLEHISSTHHSITPPKYKNLWVTTKHIPLLPLNSFLSFLLLHIPNYTIQVSYDLWTFRINVPLIAPSPPPFDLFIYAVHRVSCIVRHSEAKSMLSSF